MRSKDSVPFPWVVSEAVGPGSARYGLVGEACVVHAVVPKVLPAPLERELHCVGAGPGFRGEAVEREKGAEGHGAPRSEYGSGCVEGVHELGHPLADGLPEAPSEDREVEVGAVERVDEGGGV